MNTEIDRLKGRLDRIETIIQATSPDILQPGVVEYRERVLDETLKQYFGAIKDDIELKATLQRALLKYLTTDTDALFETATEDVFNTQGGVTITQEYTVEDIFPNATAVITLLWAVRCTLDRGGDEGEWLRTKHYRNVEILDIKLFTPEGDELSTEGLELLQLDLQFKKHCDHYLAD